MRRVILTACLFAALLLPLSRRLAARGESLTAFDERCIPSPPQRGCRFGGPGSGGVAPPSNIPDILARRALPAGRLTRLGATPDFHHGLLDGAADDGGNEVAPASAHRAVGNLVGWGFLGAEPEADVMPVSPDLQIPLILKVLTYDRHFGNRAASELKVGIVYSPENAASARANTAIAEVFQTFSDKTVKNVVIRYTSVGFTNEAALERFAQSNKVNVFYIAPGNARNLDTLLKISGGQQIVTTTGVPEYVEKGVAVGIGVRQDKPQILINLPSSKSAGVEFDASLLRIARVIR